MRTPEQVKWDFVQQWLDRARKDLVAADVLLKEGFEDYENVGFHAQQAAEKFIKAVLVRHQIEFPKTHNIALLRQLVGSVDSELAKALDASDAQRHTGSSFAIREIFPPYRAMKAKGRFVWLRRRAILFLLL
jgi:HEPN domain-containing protein